MDRQIAQLWQNGSAWRRPVGMSLVILGVIGLLFQSLMVVDAFLPSKTDTISFRGSETFGDDPDVTVTSEGIRIISLPTAAVGDNAPGVEITSALPAVNNALTQNDLVYRFRVEEKAPGSWKAGEQFRIEVY